MTTIVAISTSSFGVESARPLELLRAAGFEIRPNPHGRTLTTDEARAHLDGVVGLVAGTEKLTGPLLRELSGLKAISRVGVGIDGVDVATARELGIAVHNTPAAHVDSVAELTLGGLLAVLRRIPAGDSAIRAGRWDKPMGRLLRGRTVGLIGFGQVARALARTLRTFDCPILVTDLVEDPAAAAALGARYVGIDELVESSDVVSLHVPYSKGAHHLLDAGRIGRLRTDAVVVNTARGGLLDEAALAGFLTANPAAAAYLDTFEKEPYTGPLAALPNVVLTAHIGSYARECRVQMELEAVENLLRALGKA